MCPWGDARGRCGRDLPQAIRSAELRVRLPRHHIDMLHYRADQQETTVSGVLERELDGIASAHIDQGILKTHGIEFDERYLL